MAKPEVSATAAHDYIALNGSVALTVAATDATDLTSTVYFNGTLVLLTWSGTEASASRTATFNATGFGSGRLVLQAKALGAGGSATAVVRVEVGGGVEAPEVSYPAIDVAYSDTISVSPVVASGTPPLTYRMLEGPPFLSVDKSTGVIARAAAGGAAAQGWSGSVLIAVENPAGLWLADVPITIAPIGPVGATSLLLSVSPSAITAGDTVTITGTVTGGTATGFSVISASIGSVDQTLTGSGLTRTFTASGPGTLAVVASASVTLPGGGTATASGSASATVTEAVPGGPGDLVVSAALASRTAQDKIYSWHMDLAVPDTETGRMYFGTIDPETGIQGFLTIDDDGSVLGFTPMSTQIAGIYRDDHSAVSGVMSADGRLVAAQTGHNDGTVIYVYRSTDRTPGNLGAATTLTVADAGSGITYTQLSRLADGRIALAFRYDTNNWGLYINASNGDPSAWVRQNDIMTHTQQSYIRMIAVGNNLRVVAWQHPTNPAETTVRGDLFYREFAPGDASVALTSMARIYEGSGAGTDSIRLLSVNSDLTAFAYLDFTVGTHTNQMYRLARLTGTATDPAGWTHEDLIDTDASFYEYSHYVGGVDMANGDENRLWIARYNSATTDYTLEYWTRPDALTAWTTTTVITDKVHVARPVSPVGVDWDVCAVQRLGIYTSFYDDGTTAHAINCRCYVVSPTDSLSFVDMVAEFHSIAGTVGGTTYINNVSTNTLTIPLPAGTEAGDVITLAGVWNNSSTLPGVTVGGTTIAATSAITSGGSGKYGGKWTGIAPAGATAVQIVWAGSVPTYHGINVVQTRGTHDGTAAGVSVTTTGVAAGQVGATDLLVGVFLGASQSASHAYTPDIKVAEVNIGTSTKISAFATAAVDASGGVAIAATSPTFGVAAKRAATA